ncbi:MAG: GTP cyclohydrolase I FolE [Streptococcaceae bacterium]|jgi:GTP cyclohydrolase I|nr:GTP cyclohydrolase I FolE [Streptococcaceae bacterium]
MEKKERLEKLIFQLLQEIGENPKRNGLKETPKRVARMFDELFMGLKSPKFANFKTFQTKTNGELIIVSKIPFYSICEHHLLPFFGYASIGYIPAQNQTLGLSKFLRLVDYWSRRPFIQERLTEIICQELTKNIPNSGVGVLLKARHLCMEMRGVRNSNVLTKTECFSGDLKTSKKIRGEFFERVKEG